MNVYCTLYSICLIRRVNVFTLQVGFGVFKKWMFTVGLCRKRWLISLFLCSRGSLTTLLPVLIGSTFKPKISTFQIHFWLQCPSSLFFIWIHCISFYFFFFFCPLLISFSFVFKKEKKHSCTLTLLTCLYATTVAKLRFMWAKFPTNDEGKTPAHCLAHCWNIY